MSDNIGAFSLFQRFYYLNWLELMPNENVFGFISAFQSPINSFLWAMTQNPLTHLDQSNCRILKVPISQEEREV